MAKAYEDFEGADSEVSFWILSIKVPNRYNFFATEILRGLDRLLCNHGFRLFSVWSLT